MKLVEQGTMPKLELVNLETQFKAAEAGLAAAEAERERGVIRAPWSGIVNDVPVEVGQAAFSIAGKEIAQIVALDPMLAVVEVAERKLARHQASAIRPRSGWSPAQTAQGKVRFISKTASRDHAHLSGRGRDPQCRRRDPGRHHRRSRDSARAGRRRRACRARR